MLHSRSQGFCCNQQQFGMQGLLRRITTQSDPKLETEQRTNEQRRKNCGSAIKTDIRKNVDKSNKAYPFFHTFVFGTEIDLLASKFEKKNQDKNKECRLASGRRNP